jgi:hypothetical protein
MEPTDPANSVSSPRPILDRGRPGRAAGLPGEDELQPTNEARPAQRAEPFAEGEVLEAGVAVLRDLLQAERDRERFRQLLLAWEGMLVGAVQDGDPARAEAWLRALVTAPVYPAEFADLVGEALDEVSVPEVLDQVVACLAAAPVPGTGAGLVAAWGERMVRYLVRGMIADVPPVSRRHLTELLAWVGREDIRLLAALVGDPHWFVARNLAIALGRTGRLRAGQALEALLDHSDHRVRVEALRGLWALRGDGAVPELAAALADPEPRVRHAACSLLRASPGPAVVAAIVGVLESHTIAPAEARRLVELIAERADPGVPRVLARLAGCRRVGGAGRAVRRAARLALQERPPRMASRGGT